MEKGQIVTIYEDPITRKKPEGNAKLLALEKDDPIMQYWRVRFNNGFITSRWIRLPHNNQE